MMKFFTFKLTFSILFLLVFGIVHAQIPDGGTILNATSGTTYQWFRGDEVLQEETASITSSEAGIYSVKVKKGEVEITSEPFEIKVNHFLSGNYCNWRPQFLSGWKS